MTPAGEEFKLDGCFYTSTTDNITAQTTYLITEKSVNAMVKTLGLDGNLWRKIKGAVVAIFKAVVYAAEIIV